MLTFCPWGSFNAKLHKKGYLAPFTIVPLIKSDFEWTSSSPVTLIGYSNLWVPWLFWNYLLRGSFKDPDLDWVEPSNLWKKDSLENVFVFLMVKNDLCRISTMVIFSFIIGESGFCHHHKIPIFTSSPRKSKSSRWCSNIYCIKYICNFASC